MFDRVCLINLKKRPDRIAHFKSLQIENGWNLPDPQIFEAISGDAVGVPHYFSQGGGAWGCLRSHVTCLERAIMDDVSSILMMEDDVTWHSDAWEKLDKFMKVVPEDWDQLMLGGQHIGSQGLPVADGVVRCQNTQRTHAYAIRGKALKSLLNLWYTCGVHIDWKMGEWQKNWKCYAPDPFIFGQAAGKSDISGRINNTQFWTPPREVAVVHLTCPPEVVRKLRGYGLHTGYDRDEDDLDRGLVEVAGRGDKNAGRDSRRASLRRWLDVILWECASEEGAVACVYHPEISAEEVKKVHPDVIEVKGETVEECLSRLKGVKLKPNFAATHVLILRAPRDVAEALGGFHRGFWIDPITGQDNGVRAAAVSRDKANKLKEWLRSVTPEAEKMNAVPMVWHPEIRVEDVALATDRKVVEIEASSIEEAVKHWRAKR